MKTKILLIVPNYLWGGRSNENTLWHYIPYNLCLLAAVLEQQDMYDISIYDCFKNNSTPEEFEAIIRRERPDIVGFSILMDFYGNSAHIAASIVKKIDPSIITIVGGVYATANPNKVMQDDNVDYTIVGEGEVALTELIAKLRSADKCPPYPKGVWYRHDKTIVDGGHSDFITDLDKYPYPAYHLIDYDAYSHHAERKSLDSPHEYPYARILTSRGCPFNCCFCQVYKIQGRSFRPRSAANVLGEIEWLVNKYGIRSLLFDDDNLLTDRARAVEIFTGLCKFNFKWKMIATAAFFLDDELIELMAKSGCTYVDIAIESGCERVLREIINKPLKLDKALAVIKKLKEVGIYVAANFIVGFPGETWEEIRSSIAFAERCDADYIKLFNAVPLPGTRLYDMAVEQNALVADYDSTNVNWRNGFIETDEFTARDLSILRLYEWDRINFSTPSKIKRTADMMGISVSEMNEIRKRSRRTLQL